MFDSDPQIRQRGLEENLSLLHKQEEAETEEGEDLQEEPPKKKRNRTKKAPKLVKKVQEYRPPKVDMSVANYWNFIDHTPSRKRPCPHLHQHERDPAARPCQRSFQLGPPEENRW